MKAVYCRSCGRELLIDEIALNQRLLGQQIGTFLCTKCLSQQLGTSEIRLLELTDRFKEMGCAYFTRLRGDRSDEQ